VGWHFGPTAGRCTLRTGRARSSGSALPLHCAGIQNQALAQTLAQRVSEKSRLMASLHGFYDTALEAFAAAIDVKHVNIHGTLCAWAICRGYRRGDGLEPNDTGALRSAGICTISARLRWNKRLFGKPTSLDPEEFREMADHTIVGHQIVSGVHSRGREYRKLCGGIMSGAMDRATPTG